MSVNQFVLPGSLVYPVRITEVHVAKGQRVTKGNKIYSLVDGDGRHKAMTMAEDVIVAEMPVPKGAMFNDPAVVLHYEAAGAERKAPTAPDLPDSDDLIATLDDVAARSHNFLSYKMKVQRHLIDNGYPAEEALILSEQVKVKERWEGLYQPAAEETPPPQERTKTATVRTPESTRRGGSDRLPSPPNSYLLALLALCLGVGFSAFYVIIAIYVPLFMIGIVVSLAFAWIAIMMTYAIVRGNKVFLTLVAIIGSVVNIAAVWFVSIWVNQDFDAAVEVFSGGPGSVLLTIQYYSLFGYEFGDITSPSAFIEIKGIWLKLLWGLEAVILTSAVIVGCVGAAGKRDVSSRETAAANVATMKEEVLPAVSGIVWGTGKELLKIAVVVGTVVLASQYLW